MADGLDVVAVGILHEPAVVVGMIGGPEAGLAIVLAAGGVRPSPHNGLVLARMPHAPVPEGLGPYMEIPASFGSVSDSVTRGCLRIIPH
jgi:hypothetical protein